MTRWFNAPLRLHRRWKNASKSQKKRQIAGKYKLLHEIGQGASGIVHLAVEIKTNKRYAIKEFNKSRLERQYQSERLFLGRRARPVSCEELSFLDLSKSKKRKLNSNNQQTATIKTSTTLKEAETFKYLPKHANIIKFIEIIEDPEHQDSIFLVTEIAEKGIVMDVKPHSVTKPYSNTLCRDIFEQLVEAVDHLHQNKIIHRDIKPQNLVLSNDSTVKLIDFGNATRLTDATGHNSSSVGSPAFMAPELLKKASKDQLDSPTCSDIWSMGITLYCLAYGHLPFEKSSLLDLYADIQNKPVSHTDKIDPALIDLIDKLLQKNPKNRITLKDVKMHPWMQNK